MCPYCGEVIPIEGEPFSKLSDPPFPCKNCNQPLRLAYESMYDEETTESFGFFSLEKE
jgi:hypothetical protein